MPATPIDEAELQLRLHQILDGTVAPIAQLTGGTSSITYTTTVTSGDEAQRVVVKVAPAGLDPVRNRDVLRQARIQRALTPTDVPVPRVLAEHPGSPPDIPPFFVMAFVDGDCVEPSTLPPDQRLAPEQVRGRELHAARIMGALHRLSPAELGIADEPEVSLREEVERWQNSFSVCDEDLRAGSEAVGERLAATVPDAEPTVLIHGDFRLGNALCVDDQVTAIIDWEIWSRGDPRIDLAWFLLMANPDPLIGRTTAEGMPPNEELIATYTDARGATVPDLGWFEALVRYKQAAAAAFIARNARRRGNASANAAGNAGLLASARRILGME